MHTSNFASSAQFKSIGTCHHLLQLYFWWNSDTQMWPVVRCKFVNWRLFEQNKPIRTTKGIYTSDKTKQSVQTRIYTLSSKRCYFVWMASTDTSSNSVQQRKLIMWSKKAGNREPSQNTPPHVKLIEEFKSNKLGVSSPKKVISRVKNWQ